MIKQSLWRIKQQDAMYEIKSYFYDMWNINGLGSIDKKTQCLLAIYIESSFKIYYSDEFRLGGKVCDRVLNNIFIDIKDELDNDIDTILNGNSWLSEQEPNIQLNFLLSLHTAQLGNYIKRYFLVLNKHNNAI